MIRTMLAAWDVYGEKKYLASAKRCGDWLILAQMPDPQPAWAQQYDVNMHPVWDRKFEPPAITGSESQTVMNALLLLFRRTGESLAGASPCGLEIDEDRFAELGRIDKRLVEGGVALVCSFGAASGGGDCHQAEEA